MMIYPLTVVLACMLLVGQAQAETIQIPEVSVSSTASVLVNRDMFFQLLREAEAQGVTLAVTLIQPGISDTVSLPCCRRMKEAMKTIAPYLSKTDDVTNFQPLYHSPAASLRQQADAIDREDVAVQQFRDTLKECVQ